MNQTLKCIAACWVAARDVAGADPAVVRARAYRGAWLRVQKRPSPKVLSAHRRQGGKERVVLLPRTRDALTLFAGLHP